MLCHYQRVGNCIVVEHYANVIYVAKLTCCYFYTGQPFDCSTVWNLTHRFSNEYSEPNLIERTRFSRLLILSLDSMFGASATTLLSFLLITWKPPSLHVHRATAKFSWFYERLWSVITYLLETSSRVRYPIKSLMISSSDSNESLPWTSLFNLSSILTLICSSCDA